MSRTIFINSITNIGNVRNSKGVSIFGCSFYSMYTPVFAIFQGTHSLLHEDYCIYHHRIDNLNYKSTNYDNLISCFINRNSPFNYKHKDVNYNIRKGIITDENNNILLCICFKNYKKVIRSGPNNVTNNDLIVLVDKSFEKSLIYKNMYKRELFLDMDILVTNNVEKYCFNSGNIIPKFKNINAMQDYFKDVNNLMK